MYVVNVNVINC